MEDSEIIELFRRRSEDAIAALAQKYGGACRRLAQNILKDPADAEECVNDAYLGVWNAIPPAAPDPLFSYLCRIVRNLAIKQYRKNTAQKRNSAYEISLSELENCFASAFSVESEVDAAETARRVNAFLDTLSRRDRVLFVKRYYFCESVGALAAQFGMNEHAVSVRLWRIRGKLKTYLRKAGIPV